MGRTFSFCFFLLATGVFGLEFTSLNQEIKVEKMASNLGTLWGFDFFSEDHLILTAKEGRVYLMDKGNIHEVQGLGPVADFGQGGLMDVRIHPEDSSLVFFTYTASYGNGRGTLLARAKLEGHRLLDTKILFRPDPPGRTGRHFGSRIVFLGDYLYFGIGDRGHRPWAQQLDIPNGKIFRLHLDGRIPVDNPFVSAGHGHIWSYGHRNPQGMAIHPGTNQLWSQEHGPRGGDEINLIEKGKNYGWPLATHGREYWSLTKEGGTIAPTHREGTEQPIVQFTPSIAPSTLMIYSGKLFSAWKHHFFSSSLKFRYISRIVIEGGQQGGEEEKLVESLGERIRHIRESPSGAVYFSTDRGNLYRMGKQAP